jgi:hypothetical protein
MKISHKIAYRARHTDAAMLPGTAIKAYKNDFLQDYLPGWACGCYCVTWTVTEDRQEEKSQG